ncbi:MAG: N-acetyltransferase family protein [Velocimicrobium sp.]
MSNTTIRLATLDDAKKILEIYNPYIETTSITFEYNKLSLAHFEERMRTIIQKFPFIVYERNGIIIGYAYASSFHPRAAYAWDCDCSIYMDLSYQGKGIGTILYKTLFLLMKEMGYFNIYALVTSQNPISLSFHKKLGFEIEGHHDKTGYKFGKWLGVTRLVKRIGDFDKTPEPVKTIYEINSAPILAHYIEASAN